jgi:hypothetical protein
MGGLSSVNSVQQESRTREADCTGVFRISPNRGDNIASRAENVENAFQQNNLA